MSNAAVNIGQRADLSLITGSHGIVLPGFLENLDFTPGVKQSEIGELSNRNAAKNYNVHGAGTGKMTYVQTNELAIYAALADIELTPMSAPVGLQLIASDLRDFHCLVNEVRDDNNSSIGGKFAYKCTPGSSSAPYPHDGVTKRDMGFKFLQLFDIRGLMLRYVRARATGTQIATPAIPTATDAVAAGPFNTGDVVYYRVAESDTANTGASAPPTDSEPLSRASGEGAHLCAGTAKGVTLTFAAVPATNSLAIYASRASGQETFVGWAAAAATTFDIVIDADKTSPRPPVNNKSAAFPSVGDLVFATVGGISNAIDLGSTGKTPKFLVPSGLPYLAAMKNGALVPGPHETTSPIVWNAAATIFSLATAPAVADVWEFIVPVDPT